MNELPSTSREEYSIRSFEYEANIFFETSKTSYPTVQHHNTRDPISRNSCHFPTQDCTKTTQHSVTETAFNLIQIALRQLRIEQYNRSQHSVVCCPELESWTRGRTPFHFLIFLSVDTEVPPKHSRPLRYGSSNSQDLLIIECCEFKVFIRFKGVCIKYGVFFCVK